MPPAVVTMTNGLAHDRAEHHDAIHAELRKFRDDSKNLLTKFSELVDTASTKRVIRSIKALFTRHFMLTAGTGRHD